MSSPGELTPWQRQALREGHRRELHEYFHELMAGEAVREIDAEDERVLYGLIAQGKVGRHHVAPSIQALLRHRLSEKTLLAIARRKDFVQAPQTIYILLRHPDVTPQVRALALKQYLASNYTGENFLYAENLATPTEVVTLQLMNTLWGYHDNTEFARLGPLALQLDEGRAEILHALLRDVHESGGTASHLEGKRKVKELLLTAESI